MDFKEHNKHHHLKTPIAIADFKAYGTIILTVSMSDGSAQIGQGFKLNVND